MTRQPPGPKDWWPPRDWAEEQALRVAKEIRRLREPRSAQWLADRTKEFGYEISRSVISDLENGRRRYVTVAELMILARALNTTPAALQYPDPCADKIQMLPNVRSSGPYALQWFSGLADDASDASVKSCVTYDDPAEYRRNLQPLEIARQIHELTLQMAALRAIGRGKRGQEKDDILHAFANLQRQIDKLKTSDAG
jgi:hypothetical protein